MAIDKPSLNDFLPNGFETQDKDGYKVNFDADKISAGYDKDTLEILSGPNLNNLLDNVGKNTHVLEQFLTFFRDMPIGSFPITNASNQLDYKSVNSFFRNVGELVFSAIPLEDGNLRLLDGSLLEYNMTYSRFITYIAGYRTSLPNLFCTEQEFNQSVATYGVCGKFVYDTVTKSLRLPKISGFIKGTLDSGSLGDIDEAKAPNITGTFCADNTQVGNSQEGGSHAPTGAFYKEATIKNFDLKSDNSSQNGGTMGFDASRSSSVYKNGTTTIEPQAVKEFIYMVVSIDEAEKQVLSAVYNYKGSVPTYADLPTAVAIGEVYNVIGEDPEGYSGANFAWTGEEWDRLGGTVNLSGYLTKVEGANTYATKASLESNVDYLQQQINTNASNISNIASQEVIEQGIKKIEMLKFASTLGIGKVTDTDLFAVINKYAHSTYVGDQASNASPLDPKKFTYNAGHRPNITEDGIVSGLSNSNLIYTNYTIPFSTANSWSIEEEFNVQSLASAQRLFQTSGYNNNAIVQINTDGKLVVYLSSATTTGDIANNVYLNHTASVGDKFKAKLAFTGTAYKFYVDGVETWSLSSTTKITYNLQIYVFSGNATLPSLGQQNLKQFSITVDGVEVFSGNKTGIDTVKPDDYTVVGTPTISDDGIYTSTTTSDNNYIRLTNYTATNNLELEFEFSLSGGNYQSWLVNSLIYINYYGISDETFGANNLGRNAYIQDGHSYKIYMKWKSDNTTELGIKKDTASSYITSTGTWSSIPTVLDLCKKYNSHGVVVIDLNKVKVYVDGDLVYQPCLKIPFHLSKTGLKVTDKLDRAIDMAEQCGFSQYFGLDEDNLLCLVPQGDNITGRRELISRVEDSTTHYVTEIYSDLYCKQMGSGTASTAVTLNIPYKDEYYKLSVPQSAKSKTGFTPTASCDWTAEGYIYLDEVI